MPKKTSSARAQTRSTPQKFSASDLGVAAQTSPPSVYLPHLNLNAAAIDIASDSHFVAVPEGRDTVTVRQFGAFTADLYELAAWLSFCRIETVVMESTGIYWIPLCEILDARGFEVLLVDARKAKNVSGRKSDVLDCQWLQQLHTYGMLSGAFRPADQICVLRSYIRQRAMLVNYAAAHVQHMQKALHQMNLLLDNVVNDITGATGMAIIRAIRAGERDPESLARLRHHRCKNSAQVIAQSLVGNYRDEHLLELQQAVSLYDTYQAKIAECDQRIEQYLASLDAVTDEAPPAPAKRVQSPVSNQPRFDARRLLYQLTGVDLRRIDGIAAHTALTLISEIGTDMTRWKSVKHFASWLGLCPGTRVSGGKVLSSTTKPAANRAAQALRLAANSLYRSRSALGAYLRRQSARLGKRKAITATAHKLARLVYNLLRYGTEYVDAGQDYYEQIYKERVMKNLARRARELGYELMASPATA